MGEQLDISDDGYLNLMSDDGDTKDDVRMPDGEMGDKINKLFKDDEKETSMYSIRAVRSACTNLGTDVVILTAMGEEAAIDAKEAPKN